MAQFITPSELKAYPLPVTSAQWQKVGDDQLAIAIGYASDHLEDYMDRRIAVGNYTTKVWGSKGHSILLPQYPIVTLNYVTAYAGNNSATSYDISDFYIDHEAGILEWYNKYRYSFYGSMQWIFDYDAGYAQIPGPIKHATALQTVKMLQPLFRGGSNFVEVELVTEIDEQIIEMLEPYKRKRLG